MTRWRVQGVAVAAWLAAAVALAYAWQSSGGDWIDVGGPAINFVFVFGPVAAGVALATTLLVGLIPGLTSRALAWLHVTIGVVCVIALPLASGC